MEHWKSKRHSISAGHHSALNAPPYEDLVLKSPTHTWSDRRRSVPDERFLMQPYVHHQQNPLLPPAELVSVEGMRKNKGRKSWKNILRMKRKKAKIIAPSLVPASALVVPQAESDKNKCVRVEITEINPQVYYKTMEIRDHTTAFEVIVKLLKNYAQNEEDPNDFYLFEVKDGHQGSYSRMVGNNEQLRHLQSRWDPREDCYFALHRGQPTEDAALGADPEIETAFEYPSTTHARVEIVSPSQDSFYGSYPDFDSSFLPSFQPVSHAAHSTSSPGDSTNTSHLDPQQSDVTYRGISARSSKLAISPSESSEDSFDIGKIPKYPSVLDSRIETIDEREESSHHDDDDDDKDGSENGSATSEEREDIDKKATQRKFMQQFNSIGMQGIMAKVVEETKQNSPIGQRLHLRHHTMPSRLRGRAAQKAEIRTLACSPLAPTQIHRKQYPDFVFTHITSDSDEDIAESVKIHTSSVEKVEHDEQQTPREQEGEEKVVEEEEELELEEKAKMEEEELEGEGEGEAKMEEEEREELEEEKNEEEENTNEEDSKEEKEDGEHLSSSSLISEKETAEDFNSLSLLANQKALPPTNFAITKIIGPRSATESSTLTNHQEVDLTIQFEYSVSSSFTPTLLHHRSPTTKTPHQAPSLVASERCNYQTPSPHSPLPHDKVSPASLGYTASTSSLDLTTPFSSSKTQPLHRSHTENLLATSLNLSSYRPHNNVQIDGKSGSKGIDFTKDEIFRRAALRGMTKKSSKTRTSEDEDKGGAPLQMPSRELVTDLDAVVVDRKKRKTNLPVRSHSFSHRRSKKSLDEETSARTHQMLARKFSQRYHSGMRGIEDKKNEKDGERSPRPLSAPTRKSKVARVEARPELVPHNPTKPPGVQLRYDKEMLWWTNF